MSTDNNSVQEEISESFDEEIENLEGEVTVTNEATIADAGLSDEEEFAYKIVKRAATLKGVRIDRSVFLRTEFSKYCSPETVEAAVNTTTQQAGISMQIMDVVADAAIDLETKKVSGLSALAGIPGGLAMFGTVPADLVNYFAHVLRVEQKLAYIYGWPTFLDDNDEIDDETMYRLILFLGVIMQVGGINVSLTSFASHVAMQGVAKTIEKQALTKQFWFPILKKVMAVLGVKVTKKNFAQVVAKGVPIIGGVISGGITFVTFRPGADGLKNHLRLLPQATGQVVDDAVLVEELDAEDEHQQMQIAQALEGIGEQAAALAGSAADVAGKAGDVVGKAAGAAVSGIMGAFGGLTSLMAKGGNAPESSAGQSLTAAKVEELRMYKSLLDEGLISQEDFDAKKSELLGL